MKEINGWKITAIIFITLFVGIILLILWGVAIVNSEEKATNECYYNTCEDYQEATYDEGVCRCYGIDDFGDLELSKTTYLR